MKIKLVKRITMHLQPLVKPHILPMLSKETHKCVGLLNEILDLLKRNSVSGVVELVYRLDENWTAGV